MSSVNRVALDKKIRASFSEVDINKKAFVILVNGKRVKVRTGKSVWTTTGAAKNALTNHLYYLYNSPEIYSDPKINEDYKLRNEAIKEAKLAAKEWIEQNISVVSVGEYEATQAKLKNK